MYLKPFLFTVCFLSVSFIGMQVVVKMRADEAAAKRAVAKMAAQKAEAEAKAEEDAKQAEAPATESKPAAPPVTAAQTPPKVAASQPSQVPPVIINSADPNPPQVTFPTQSAPGKSVNTRSLHTTAMYFEPVNVGTNGVPARVWIRNTPVKDCLILMVGSGKSDGRLYTRKGATVGAVRHHWEVRVESGHVSVLWDGQPVPPAASVKGSTSR